MSRRDLSVLDRDIGQPWSRIIMESFRDGSTGAKISEGGLIPSQTAQRTLEVSATQAYTYGTKREEDGKIYRYAKGSTATALIAGNLCESPQYGGAASANEEDCVIATASAAGASVAYATQKSSSMVANACKDGYYLVNDGTAAQGCGQLRKILSHAASTGTGSSVAYTFTEALNVLVSTAATAIIVQNPYKNVLMTTTGGVLGSVMGVPRVAVPTTTPYCWLQTRGVAGVLTGATATTLGKKLHRDIATGGAGAVTIDNTSTGVLTEVVGYALAACDATDHGCVFLTIE